MYEEYNLEKKCWEVIDSLLGTGVLFSHPDRQKCVDYIEEHENDIAAFVL